MAKVFLATDIGPRRDLNEDVIAELGNETYVVADGMGGYAAGEVASRILVDTVQAELALKEHIDEDTLKNAMLLANTAILQTVSNHPKYAGMGTTATIFHRDGQKIVWAHVGDSRLYLLHENLLQQITHDHSLVSDLVDNGSITPEEARQHPKRNVITRAVGVTSDLAVDTGVFPVYDGDILMLSSDGLTSVVSDEEICKMLLHSSMEDNIADSLVKHAISAGSHDNISVIVVRI